MWAVKFMSARRWDADAGAYVPIADPDEAARARALCVYPVAPAPPSLADEYARRKAAENAELSFWLASPGSAFKGVDRTPVQRLADVEPMSGRDVVAEVQRQVDLYAKKFASDFDHVLAGMPATSEAWKAAVCPVGTPTHRIDDALLALNQRHESALADLHATKRERDELLMENARLRRKIEAHERGKRGQ